MASGRQRHLRLRERLDLVADDVDPSLVGGVQFEHGRAEGGAEHVSSQCQDGGGFTDTRRALSERPAVTVLDNASSEGDGDQNEMERAIC